MAEPKHISPQSVNDRVTHTIAEMDGPTRDEVLHMLVALLWTHGPALRALVNPSGHARDLLAIRRVIIQARDAKAAKPL